MRDFTITALREQLNAIRGQIEVSEEALRRGQRTVDTIKETLSELNEAASQIEADLLDAGISVPAPTSEG